MQVHEDKIFEILKEQLVEGKADPDNENFSMDMWMDWDKGLRTCARVLAQTELIESKVEPALSIIAIRDMVFSRLEKDIPDETRRYEVALAIAVHLDMAGVSCA